jgi:hypothetical protein
MQRLIHLSGGIGCQTLCTWHMTKRVELMMQPHEHLAARVMCLFAAMMRHTHGKKKPHRSSMCHTRVEAKITRAAR